MPKASELIQALEQGKCVGIDKRYSDESKPRWLWVRDADYFQVCGWGSSLVTRQQVVFQMTMQPDVWIIGHQEEGEFVPDEIEPDDDNVPATTEWMLEQSMNIETLMDLADICATHYQLDKRFKLKGPIRDTEHENTVLLYVDTKEPTQTTPEVRHATCPVFLELERVPDSIFEAKEFIKQKITDAEEDLSIFLECETEP